MIPIGTRVRIKYNLLSKDLSNLEGFVASYYSKDYVMVTFSESRTFGFYIDEFDVIEDDILLSEGYNRCKCGAITSKMICCDCSK